MKDKIKSPDRRKFLGSVAATAAAAIPLSTLAQDIGPQGGRARAEDAEKLRVRVAEIEGDKVSIPNHRDNGDEELYVRKFASYSKCMKHDPVTGEPDLHAYNALFGAITSGRFSDFEALFANGHMGSADPSKQRRLVNPVSSYGYDLEGTDSHQLILPPAPKFASAEEAGEMVELYWMALLRDIDFASYNTDATVAAAAADISKLSDFRGPKVSGVVTSQTLFRDNYPGCTVGPYISQFLLQPVKFGTQSIDTRVQSVVVGTDFMTTFAEWLDVQNGVDTSASPFSGTAYIANGRHLGHYVNIDALFQAYFIACLNLLGNGYFANSGNPYGKVIDGGAGRARNLVTDPEGSVAQVGFGTFGAPAVLTLTCESATRALKNEWYQKWLVHRRLRPEEFAGRVEAMRLGKATYPFHQDLTHSSVLGATFSKFGSHLQAQAYAEGSPNHPSYASGHGTVAGACVTILKALFDGSQLIKNPVIPNPADGGATLIPYVAPAGEPPLTVEGELNKVVSNVSQGRNIAGVHWRTDAVAANLLGEATAISMLSDARHTFGEPFNGYTFNKFDGSTITV